MTTDRISFLLILAYLGMMLFVTAYQSKKSKSTNATGFFLANRGVSSILLPLTMIAAMQSTFAFLGAPGMYYMHGTPFMVMVLSQVWVAFMVIYFGNKIRKLAVKHDYMSIGDYFKDRYNSNFIKILASIISVLMTMVFLAMQYVGNARAMSVITNGTVNYEVAIMICVLFSLAYVLIGGAGGVVFLDAIQAIVLMVGIVIAAAVAIIPSGGIVELFKTAAENTPELLSRPGLRGMYSNKFWIMQFIVLPFGIWFCPHIWSRSLMAKDEKALARSAISVPVSQLLIFGFSTLFIGIAAHNLIGSDIKAADTVLPLMMMQYSNWFLAAIIMAAAISAGMSTINSMLLVSSQIVSQDLILSVRKEKVSDKQNLFISRIVVFSLAAIAALIALRPPESLVQVVQSIAYTGLAQLAPAFILGLYWKNARREGAALGMFAGIVILFATRILNISPLGYPGFMWAFFSNIIIIILVSLALKGKKDDVELSKFF